MKADFKKYLRSILLNCLVFATLLTAGWVHAQGQSTAESVGAATGGAAPGGIFIRTRAPSLPAIKNVRYDVDLKAIVTDDWSYPLPVSSAEARDIFSVVAKQDFLAADVSTRGELAVFGLPPDSKVASRMLIADLLLGDIGKGIGYFAPIYKTAADYKPKQYNVLTRRPFVVFFVFTSNTWLVDGKTLVSQPAKLESVGAPTQRQADGTRRFDFDAMKRNAQDDDIAANSKHIMENEAYYRRERAVRDVQSYADLAQLARELRQQGVAVAALIK